jgi:hypothetical protein
VAYVKSTPAYYFESSGTKNTFSACQALCKADTKCKSFGYGEANCMLFDVNAYVVFLVFSYPFPICLSFLILTYPSPARTIQTTTPCRPTPSTTSAALPNSLSASANSTSTCPFLVVSTSRLDLEVRVRFRQLVRALSQEDRLRRRSRRQAQRMLRGLLLRRQQLPRQRGIMTSREMRRRLGRRIKAGERLTCFSSHWKIWHSA